MPHEPITTLPLTVAVLLSVGRHPVTGRARRADQDARGLELALSMAAARIELVHAGPFDDACEVSMRGYLGMSAGHAGSGADSVTLVDQPSQADVVPALCRTLSESLAPQLVIAGERAEQGEGSGMLPYQLSESLGWPLVGGIVAVEGVEEGVATLLQALPRGQRRRLSVRLPVIVMVNATAMAPRQSAFGPARRGTLAVVEQPAVHDAAQDEWRVQPARKRPKRLKIVKATSARERFKAAAAKSDGGGGQIMKDVSPDEAAAAIHKLLKEEDVLR
ncbi:electron transfer flavoprotein subunit beta [Aidingimonas lacisalsi]|uniref:electron transfer flavoprotein subunit beta n=1 Tax=Aidingimonas lacisalsi TaxID=2604086 RepID=UPI0011D2A7EF|nr:electron transfer flavoprotein subunit beta [Aidingimonas lacisalsi]